MPSKRAGVSPGEAATQPFTLTTLRVLRRAKIRRTVAEGERALVVAWNALCPAGTAVRYYPIWGRWGEYRDEVIDRPASILPSGNAVLWLSESRCVAARHCEPAALQPSAGAVAAVMQRSYLAPQREENDCELSEPTTEGRHHVE